MKSIKIFKNKKGFTLIELLIVVALLGILGSVVMVSFIAAQKSARDANRKSDLSQYRDALEAYANKNVGLYPVHSSAVDADTICGASELNLPSCVLDSKDGTAPYGYKYVSDAGGTKYLLYAALEKLPAGFATYYFGLCSTGSSIAQQAAPTIASCP